MRREGRFPIRRSGAGFSGCARLKGARAHFVRDAARQALAPTLGRFLKRAGIFFAPYPARYALVGLLFALAPVQSAADEAAWRALSAPGAVAFMRHALAPGGGDPANFTPGDCSTQRNLNDAGRAQAAAIGKAFRSRGIAVDRVFTSAWCRSRETAELLDLGAVTEMPALDSFFRRRRRAEPQTTALKNALRAKPSDETWVLVSHFVNVRALTGLGVPSGGFVVLSLEADGSVEVAGEISIPVPRGD